MSVIRKRKKCVRIKEVATFILRLSLFWKWIKVSSLRICGIKTFWRPNIRRHDNIVLMNVNEFKITYWIGSTLNKGRRITFISSTSSLNELFYLSWWWSHFFVWSVKWKWSKVWYMYTDSAHFVCYAMSYESWSVGMQACFILKR